jgi:cystathionine beta-synthase
MNGDVDAIVVGVGSGGTIAGLTHYFKKVSKKTEMILADPEGSLLKGFLETGKIEGHAGSWMVEGLGGDCVPAIADFSSCKKAYSISDAESFHAARELLLKEGILGGSSSGTLLAAALRYCQESKTKKRVVTFICDSGNKYLSKFYNDHWMRDHGFIKLSSFGDLRDIVTRRYREGHVVSVSPDQNLWGAYSRMKSHGFSQLPVIEKDDVIGIIDESDLLLAIHEKQGSYEDPVRKYMTTEIEKIKPDTPLRELLMKLDRGFTGILYDSEGFFGIVTRTDVLNYLRRKSTEN